MSNFSLNYDDFRRGSNGYEDSKPESVRDIVLGVAKASLMQWLLAFLAVLLGIVIAIKIAHSSLHWDFSGFKFTDLLSLLVSFFAIALSVAFYFKATESSNEFYDNTYKFTKDISTMLGRIEAGFGERLRHIDEGYNGILNRFTNGADQKIEQTEQDIETEELKAKVVEDERQQIIEGLIRQANIQNAERDEILRRLRESDQSISNYQREIGRLRVQLNQVQGLKLLDSIPNSILNILREMSLDKRLVDSIRHGSQNESRKIAHKMLDRAPQSVLDALMHYGIIRENSTLTRTGFQILVALVTDYTA